MGRKRHTPEQIITALREAEVGLARGKSREADEPVARHHRAAVIASASAASFFCLLTKGFT